MGLVDSIVEFIEGAAGFQNSGGGGWQDRIRGEVTMISPDGNEFTPKWIGDPRSKTKKLGIFDYAKVKGTIVQDLGITSSVYPLTLYFDGRDNDKAAEDFYKACDETGQWEITHPTKGFLGLQLMKVSEIIAPVTDGAYTLYNTEWIEPIDPLTLKTTAQLAAEAGKALNEFNSVSADQFADKLKVKSLSEKLAISETVGKITGAADTVLGPIASVVDGINSVFNEVLRGIQDVLQATVFDALALAAQIQQLMQLPALAIRDTKSRLNAYSGMAELISSIPVGKTIAGAAGIGSVFIGAATTEAKNIAAVKELAYVGIIGALSIVATTTISKKEQAKKKGQTATGVVLDVVTQIPVTTNSGAVQTQSQIVEYIESIAALNISIIDDLDKTQQGFVDSEISIDEQYFSQTQTFAAGMNLTALGQAFLLQNFYDLKIEKTFILTQPKTPIQITIEEYGEMGENDSNLDLLSSSNGFRGNEIILVPIGREILIYA